MRKLLIADCNEDYRTALAHALEDSYSVLTCRSGAEAMELLHAERPDILILDLLLPELDGLTLLERISAQGIHPMVLAATPVLTDYVTGCFQRLGIEYIIRKPCEIEAIAARVQDLSRRLKAPEESEDPHHFVRRLLLSLNVSTKHDGYNYLCQAIILMSGDLAQSVTKILYPAVAHNCGCKKDSVERSIRTALERAWERGDRALWQHYFPNQEQRPSNAVFITRMAEELLRKQE